MTSLKILSGGAAQGLVANLAPTFKDQTGLDIEGEFGAVGAMAGKLREGTPTDLVVLTAALIADLAKEKLVVGTSARATSPVMRVPSITTAQSRRTLSPSKTVPASTAWACAPLISSA